MLRELREEDLEGVAGCRHHGGEARQALLAAYDDFFTPARRQALASAIQSRVPQLTLTPKIIALGMAEYAAREAARLEGA